MATSTPVSQKQATKFVVDALGDPSGARMQYLLANSSLFKELAQADFSRIDRAAFTASLTPTPAPRLTATSTPSSPAAATPILRACGLSPIPSGIRA